MSKTPKSKWDWVLIWFTLVVFTVAATGALWSFTHQAR